MNDGRAGRIDPARLPTSTLASTMAATPHDPSADDPTLVHLAKALKTPSIWRVRVRRSRGDVLLLVLGDRTGRREAWLVVDSVRFGGFLEPMR
jgi:hypothetical protein